MNLFLWNVVLAFIYAAVSDSFTPATFAFGFVLGYLALLVSTRRAKSRKYFTGLKTLFSFIFYYLGEFLLASLRVTQDALRIKSRVRPGIVAVPLDCKTDSEINLLANLVTLTPGGISLELSSDKKVLYLYDMYFDPKKNKVDEIKQGLERRVLELLR